MPERPIRGPEIPLRTLGGLNERPSKANLQPGEFDILQGLYPKDIGLLARIPGKVFLAQVDGQVRTIYSTGNSNGDVLVQAGSTLYASTLDELLGRPVTPPSLIFVPVFEEEDMPMAIIVQREANANNGGSLDGAVTANGVAASNTFYGRRLTNLLVNESTIVTTFTASGAASGSPTTSTTPTTGTFALGDGDYRITVDAVYNAADPTGGTECTGLFGLYNVTGTAFEVYSGTSDRCVSSISAQIGNATTTSPVNNISSRLDCKITVTGGPKTFAIMHQGSTATVQQKTFCGARTTAAGTVGGLAPLQTYCFIKILKAS